MRFLSAGSTMASTLRTLSFSRATSAESRLSQNDVAFHTAHALIHGQRFVVHIDVKFIQRIDVGVQPHFFENFTNFYRTVERDKSIDEKRPAHDVRNYGALIRRHKAF